MWQVAERLDSTNRTGHISLACLLLSQLELLDPLIFGLSQHCLHQTELPICVHKWVKWYNMYICWWSCVLETVIPPIVSVPGAFLFQGCADMASSCRYSLQWSALTMILYECTSHTVERMLLTKCQTAMWRSSTVNWIYQRLLLWKLAFCLHLHQHIQLPQSFF